MKWELSFNGKNVNTGRAYKIYTNNETGSECKIEHIYTDRLDIKWWGFSDLFAMPYIRIAFAKTISDLFLTGLTATDLRTWISKEKELLKSNDKEKYEKLYAMVLEKESVIENTVDPIKQHLALCTVYVMEEDEKIDYYSQSMAGEKLEKWKLDIDAQTFFLNWRYGHINRYYQDLKNITEIASSMNPDQKMNRSYVY